MTLQPNYLQTNANNSVITGYYAIQYNLFPFESLTLNDFQLFTTLEFRDWTINTCYFEMLGH